MSIRKDLYKINIQDNIYLLVFHKTHNEGSGPAVSLYINEFEFLKFDCFGKDLGHYHIFYKTYNDMIYFTEKTRVEQINKTVYELLNNLNFYLQKSDISDIKNFTFNSSSNINNSIELMKEKMLLYEEKFYKSSI